MAWPGRLVIVSGRSADLALIAMRHADRVSDHWPCRHFSLANPRPDGADLPRLFRRLADEVERLDIDPLGILDMTVSHEMTEDGPWWSATLYWSPEGRTRTGCKCRYLLAGVTAVRRRRERSDAAFWQGEGDAARSPVAVEAVGAAALPAERAVSRRQGRPHPIDRG